MPAYIVERSLPALSDKHRSALQYALREASRRLTASGSPVRYLRSTFVPTRSRCYCYFEAATRDRVRAVNEAALVPFIAIDEAIELPAAGSATNERSRRIRPSNVKP